MKRLLFIPLLFCALFCMAQNKVSVSPAKPMNKALSGHYAGWIEDRLSVYGGCNFNENGEKIYYPKAYGASVQVPGGVVYLGGMNDGGSISECTFINAKTAKDSTTIPLPKALDNFAATYHDGYIWVAGGKTQKAPNKDVYVLPFPGGKKWTVATTLPDECRMQPCVAVQKTSSGEALFVFGGYQSNDEGLTPKVHTDGVYIPIDQDNKGRVVAHTNWKRTSQTLAWAANGERKQYLQAIVGTTCTPVGYSHIMFFGGVNHDIFLAAITGEDEQYIGEEYLNHEPEWYKFRKDILIYNTVTDSWGLLPGNSLLARAGACLTPEPDGGWSYSGGELKPRVRSNNVTHIKVSNDKNFGWINWTVLIIYLTAMLGMGFYFMRKEKGADDFFKGGGRIPWWAAGISIYATMLSAITYMTIPAKAYNTDWTYYPMLWMILLVSFPVIKYYLPYFRKLNVTSAYEILEKRFNLFTRMLASTLFCIFMIVRMAIVLYLPSLALTAVTGIDIYMCIVLMGLITIIYCTMGGVTAVIWGDVVQGVILVFGAIFAVVYLAVGTEGGISGCIDIALENDKLRLFDFSNSWSQATWWVIILGGLANNLISYTSDQTVIQRYLTTSDEKSAGRSILINGLMSVFVSVAFYMIGTGLFTFYKTHPAELDVTMQQSDAIFPFFMMSQMPAGVAGALIAAIFAATMSTISSNINSVATAFSIDFWKRFRPSTSDKSLVVVARWASVVSGMVGLLLALFMATWEIQSFLDFFNEALGLLTSGLGGLFFIAVFMKRVKGFAALTGFIVGEFVVFWMSNNTDANFLLFGAIGMVVSIVVAWMLSIGSYLKSSK